MNSELKTDGFVFDIIWERVQALTGWKNYGQMADFLGIKPASVAGAKKRGFISLEWVFKIAQGYNASTDWIATGKGPIKRGEGAKPEMAKEPPATYATPMQRAGDPEIAEIVNMLEHDLPEAKKFVLKVLRGKKEVKEGMEGLGIKLIDEE